MQIQYIPDVLNLYNCARYFIQGFFFQGYGDHRDLHYPLRRQRQMCIRDSFNVPRNFSQQYTPQTFDLCSGSIYNAFNADFSTSSTGNLTVILQNVPVLLYQGQLDGSCPTPTIQNWMQTIVYNQYKDFKRTAKQIWSEGNQVYGSIKQSGKLTYVQINKAGHMVPHDQPAVALKMLRNWFSGIGQN
eukprot:TRINITY_DN6991_c0_g1_i12.p1 TRINITY_DN6991_c0_g1~~TRINITY_DN6991_c0_g1_i12.p1  ORF type:complete len:187 (+),score=10.73 TRINITY_DN6991_c0_g1_i12:3-563(+)